MQRADIEAFYGKVRTHGHKHQRRFRIGLPHMPCQGDAQRFPDVVVKKYHFIFSGGKSCQKRFAGRKRIKFKLHSVFRTKCFQRAAQLAHIDPVVFHNGDSHNNIPSCISYCYYIIIIL